MELPPEVSAYGWIPFVVVFLSTICFSWFYVRHFQSRYDSELSSTITSILGLVVTLVITLLIPVDVFLVSFMKNYNGTYKLWANDSADRQAYENDVLYAYYSLYSVLLVFVFFLIPFIYFFYEENDEESISRTAHLCTAFKYTIVFVLVAGVLLLLGAFIPMKSPPTNSTNWEKFEYLFNELEKNRGEDALSFVLNVLSLVGMLLFIIYTGYGFSVLPCNLIKGSRDARAEHEECQNRRIVVQAKINAIRDKYRNGRPMRNRDHRELEGLEEEERLMSRQVMLLENQSRSWWNKCVTLLRPFQVVFGALFSLFGLLIFLSLLLTCIDKAMNSVGYDSGFILKKRKLPNPIDIVFVYAQEVFPLDYILFLWVVLFFFMCTMSGIQQLGVWFLWIRMYSIRPHRTRPQGLLMLCMIVMLVMLALNVVLYSLVPEYTMYGSQHYMNGTEVISCNTEAPAGECTMSRMSSLLARFFYKAWIFGAAYYYGTWIFLAAVVLGSIVSLFRRPLSAIEGAVHKDDFEESDDDLLPA